MINIGIISERLLSLSKSKKLIMESCTYPCNILNYSDLVKYLNECKNYNDYQNAIKSLKSEKLSPIDIKHGATYIAENIIPSIKKLDTIIDDEFVKSFDESYYDLIKSCEVNIHDFYKQLKLNQSEPSKEYQLKKSFNENNYIEDCLINEYIEEITNINEQSLLLKNIMDSCACSYKSCQVINNFLNENNIGNCLPTKNEYEKKNALIRSCKLLQETAKKYRAADRVINNHNILSNRYNFDKIVDENKNLFTNDQSDCIYEMCKLMDTFNLSFDSRYNMYLENTLYLLHKNGINYDINNIAESVTDYIMMAYPMNENNINTINKILNSNIFFKDTDFSKKINESNQYDFKKSYLNYINESYYNTFDNVKNDQTLSNVIEVDLSNLYNEGLKYYNQWINENKSESKENAKSISNNFNKIKSLVKKSTKEGIEDGKKINEDDSKVSELINDFKKQDKKDVGKLKSLIIKIYSKDPEDAINNTPSIFNIIRIALTLGVSAFMPVVGVIMLIVDQVISLNINRKQTDKLIKYFYNEREKVESKLYNASGDKKENLKAYLNKIDDAINKLENHKDDLKSDIDNDDDDDKDIINDMAYIMSMCESADIIDKFDVNIITNAIKEHYRTIPGEFIDSVTELSLLVNEVVSREKILEALEYAYNSINESGVDDIIALTNIQNCLSENISKIRHCECDYEDFNIPIIELADILTSLQNSITQENCLHEGMSFKNTFKLAAINIKDKITNLSDKEKSACKTINAMANNIKNKIETSITNSNREAVIKGSILPSFSTLIKMIIASTAALALQVHIGIIVAGWIGALACRSIMTNKERVIVLDDIESEIEVVEKKMSIAEREEDFDRYKELLKLSKKLKREAQRIRYKANAIGRNIPKIE